jgi:hypothetical protein
MAPRTRDFVAGIERFVKARYIPMVEFRKDDVMAEHLQHFSPARGCGLRRESAGEDAIAPAKFLWC